MEFNKILSELMDARGVSAYRLAKDTGISDSVISYYRNGRMSPNADNLVKLAAYFSVTTDYLLGLDVSETKNPASGADIKFALFGGDGEITDEMYDDVKRFAAFIKQQKEQESKKSEG